MIREFHPAAPADSKLTFSEILMRELAFYIHSFQHSNIAKLLAPAHF
jgi:hypothetical protein